MHYQVERRTAHHFKDTVWQGRVTVGADFPNDLAVHVAEQGEGGSRDGGGDAVGEDVAGSEDDVSLGRGTTPDIAVESARMEGNVGRRSREGARVEEAIFGRGMES